MSSLVKLNLKTAHRTVEKDPVTMRREKLAAAIQEQLSALAAQLAGQTYTVAAKRAVKNAEGVRTILSVQRQVRVWYFAQDGGWYVQCRYGTRVLMLHGKSNAVFVEKQEQVSDVFSVFKAAALAGELDRAILLVMRPSKKQSNGKA